MNTAPRPFSDLLSEDRALTLYPDADESAVDARLADMIASGLVEWNGAVYLPEEPAFAGPEDFSLSEWVIAEREAVVERLL